MRGQFLYLFVPLCEIMKLMRKIISILVFTFALSATGQRQSNHVANTASDSLSVHFKQYGDSLQKLIDGYRTSAPRANGNVNASLNPYYFPLFSSATIFNNPLRQSMGLVWNAGGNRGTALSAINVDRKLVTLSQVNDYLANMYACHPELFEQTQDQMMEEGAFVADVKAPLTTDNKLSDQIQLVDIEHEVVDPIVAITRKPNFWTLKGSTSLQFTQSYFTDNWYQGGDNNYAALGMFTFEAKYDNKQKLQWENKLEAQLGFQTTKGDSCHSLKVTSNLLRLTSKVGYKAFKNWYYTAGFQGYTQLYPNYNTNSYKVTTDINSPLYLSFSVGMDFKWKLKRFEGSLYMAPIEVNARYVDRKELRARYNDNENQATKWTWGPKITVNYKWKIVNDVEWQSRIYCFTNLHYTNMEWENTFTFNVNKYLNCKLFVYPKYIDDKKYGKAKGDPERGYWMFKEWLSLGLSYSW